MKFLYSWLKDYVELEESPAEVAEILSAHAFETAIIQKIGSKDAILEIEPFPNRVGDAASHFGIARELAMILKRPLKENRKWKLENSKRKASDFVVVKVEDSILCPRYSARVVTDVKVGQSPLWLKKRLAACGLRPINNIVDITNYVMLEMGEPLHAFDLEKIENPKSEIRNPKRIIVRRASKGEKIDALDAKSYALTPDDLVIVDANGPLAIAGIKGGRRAEIDKKTKTIVLEAASFDAITIRKTAGRLGLRTDSSWRFENGMDPNITIAALERAAGLIAEIAGGKVTQGTIDLYPRKVSARKIIVDIKKLQALIGQGVSAKEVIALLKPILQEWKILPKSKLLLLPITARRDLEIPEDIAEEVARLLGYQNLSARPALAELALPQSNKLLEFRELLRDRLVGMGFSEVYNYSFISENDLRALAIDARGLLRIENPISSEAAYLKNNLLAGILKNVSDNLRFFEEVRIFEIGKVFELAGNAPTEEWRFAGAFSRKGARVDEAFFEAKGVIEGLLKSIGYNKRDYAFSELGEDQYFALGSAALLRINGRAIGQIGVIRPTCARLYDIDSPLAYWDIAIDPFLGTMKARREFKPLVKYPDVTRDISLLTLAGLRVSEIENAITKSGAEHISDIQLFDIYQGKGLPHDKIAMAFHLIFRATDRTLTDQEVNQEMEKIVIALKAIGAEIR